MRLQEIRSPIIACNVLLCKTTLHVIQCVKKHTGFIQTSFTSAASSCQNTLVYVILQTPTIRVLTALRRFSQNSQASHRGVYRDIFFFRICFNSDGGVGEESKYGKCKDKFIIPLSQVRLSAHRFLGKPQPLLKTYCVYRIVSR
jgi:hypothetical protein